MRIGHGYDVHRLVSGRPLILGGTSIPHSKGLDGHSDADVLIHAICDAILGALALGDIGQHFPDSDPKFKDVDSRMLLRKIVDKMHKKNYKLVNLDATVIAQQPKLAPHFPVILNNLVSDLSTDINRVNVKATTTEKLGPAGREEGIEAHAVVLLELDN